MHLQRVALRLLKRTPVFGCVERMHSAWWHYRATRRGTFAQHGEDLFVLRYFNGRLGTYIDVGANHPFKISNTYLLYRHGWRGVTMEPIPWLFRKHERLRPEDIHLNCAAGEAPGKLVFHEMTPSALSTFDETTADRFVRQGQATLRCRHDVTVLRLADVWQEHLGGRSIDLLSIDAEGFELPILRGHDWDRARPKLVICELSQPGEDEASCEIMDFFAARSYRLIQRLGCNGAFERAPGT